MADTRASDILDKHERMRQQRVYFEKQWQDVADRILPRKAEFKRQRGKTTEPKGEKRTDRIFDATPALALDRFAAAMHSLVTPRNQDWHGLKPQDPDLAEDTEVMTYLETVTRRLFSARYSSNFDNQVHECYFDAGAFGNMALFVGDRLGRSIYYRTVPVDQLFFMENEFGVVDLVHREFAMTARQAMQKFGRERLPPMTPRRRRERGPSKSSGSCTASSRRPRSTSTGAITAAWRSRRISSTSNPRRSWGRAGSARSPMPSPATPSRPARSTGARPP